MAQNTFNFVVIHHVHQATVDTNTAVRHRPCVDVAGHINLIVDRRAINIVTQCFGDFCQTFTVLAGFTCDLIAAVHFGTALIGNRFCIGIA
ncbi:hypothetical protein DP20_3696 [Shigella flexneri]|nr:hypothetical protein DP20_3696 [Shigella flexneri]